MDWQGRGHGSDTGLCLCSSSRPPKGQTLLGSIVTAGKSCKPPVNCREKFIEVASLGRASRRTTKGPIGIFDHLNGFDGGGDFFLRDLGQYIREIHFESLEPDF